jgi:hypothetical protein
MKEGGNKPHYQPDQIPAPHQRGEGIRGVPPPQGEQAKPLQEGGERKKRRYLVKHPNETFEEYHIRYHQEHARRKIEDAERREKKLNYYRDRYKRFKEQRQAASAQQEEEQQPTEAVQIFPSPREGQPS